MQRLFFRFPPGSGHLDLARNRPQQALAAFANATQLNPALGASWRKQAVMPGGCKQHKNNS